MTEPEIIRRLEEAGSTLLSLPSVHASGLRNGAAILRASLESYGWTNLPLDAPAPAPEAITAMDEALSWLSLIPPGRMMLRRVVGARCLVHPSTERHLFAWDRLAAAIGAHRLAVQRWHATGISLIAGALNEKGKP